MKKIIYYTSLLIALSFFPNLTQATELKIENVHVIDRPDVLSSPYSVTFDIQWKNAWNNARNHDAVWIFMKYDNYWNGHVKIKKTGHRIVKNYSGEKSNPKIDVSEDGLGFFVYPEQNYRGDVSYRLQIMIDTTGKKMNWRELKGLKVHGVEMVYIPEGGFTIGSPDEDGIKRASFYKSDAEGKPNGLIKIESEAAIPVGAQKDALYYWSENALYNGDQKGPVPADFPKGFDAFYIMKYELTQGQYADFLNGISDGATFDRSMIGGRGYYKKRGGIRIEDGKYIADNPYRPMNQVGFIDALAYTDWAALRPVTELEYEKACRGPETPKPAEFVWGTNNYDDLERMVEGKELVLKNGVDESQLTHDNRPTFGASYYWVMDLSGSVWEKVITIGNPVGREFKGSHGDGKLRFGKATNEDWPKSDDEVGGFGYRGGGYYDPSTLYGDFNPHSPIGYRYYGSWSGGPRSIAYGYRAGRGI